jgi:S-adenosylmethionine/arginine decarboxylase-like enzyme
MSMKNLAPGIVRQRLLIEGFYNIVVDESAIGNYFKEIAASLDLKIYGEPIIFSPAGMGKETNQGYDAFVPLVDSGISAYIWTNAKFFSIIIYTCKNFKDKTAIEKTKEFFKAKEIELQSF